jgi:hypothetical protein
VISGPHERDRVTADLRARWAKPHGFATAELKKLPYPLVRFAQALAGGTVKIVKGQWVPGRGGGNPGVAANWNSYPDTGWVGVILANCDEVPLQEMVQQELQAVTGQPVSGAGSGGGG